MHPTPEQLNELAAIGELAYFDEQVKMSREQFAALIAGCRERDRMATRVSFACQMLDTWRRNARSGPAERRFDAAEVAACLDRVLAELEYNPNPQTADAIMRG